MTFFPLVLSSILAVTPLSLSSSIPIMSTVEESDFTSIPEWTGEKPHYNYSWAQCIKQGPTNLRLEPNFAPEIIRATIRTGSCGHLITHKNDFALLEFYIVELGEIRRYWVHESQFSPVIHPQE